MLTSCSLSLPPSFNSLQTAGKSLLVYQNEKGVWEALAVNTASSEAPDSPEPPPQRVVTACVASRKASAKLPLVAAGAAILGQEKKLVISKYGTYF